MAQLSLGMSRSELCSPSTAHSPQPPVCMPRGPALFHLAHQGIHKCRLGLEHKVGEGAYPSIRRPPSVLGHKMKSLFF